VKKNYTQMMLGMAGILAAPVVANAQWSHLPAPPSAPQAPIGMPQWQAAPVAPQTTPHTGVQQREAWAHSQQPRPADTTSAGLYPNTATMPMLRPHGGPIQQPLSPPPGLMPDGYRGGAESPSGYGYTGQPQVHRGWTGPVPDAAYGGQSIYRPASMAAQQDVQGWIPPESVPPRAGGGAVTGGQWNADGSPNDWIPGPGGPGTAVPGTQPHGYGLHGNAAPHSGYFDQGYAPQPGMVTDPGYHQSGHAGGGASQPGSATSGAACPTCGHGHESFSGYGSPVLGGPRSYRKQLFGGGPCGTAGGLHCAGDRCQLTGPVAGSFQTIGSPGVWFGGANALIFRQHSGRHVRMSFDSDMPTPSVLSTKDADFGTFGGFEVFGGRYFNCGRSAVMGRFWALYPGDTVAEVHDGGYGNLRSAINFTEWGPTGMPDTNGITMPGDHVYGIYDGARAHRLVRSQQFTSAEINLLSFALGGAARSSCCLAAGGCGSGCGDCGSAGCGDVGCASGCGTGCGAAALGGLCGTWTPGVGTCRLRFTPLIGLRWLRFGDNLEFAASQTDTMFGTGPDDFYYRNHVTNDLVGLQLGGMGHVCFGPRLALYAGSTVGLYGNHIRARSFAGYEGDPATVISGNAHNGMPYILDSSDTVLATAAELDTGASLRLSRCWSANVGYRILGISGVANGIGQIPYDFGHLGEAAYINAHQSVILHGLTLGLSANF